MGSFIHTAYLLMGGNLGQREELLAQARQLIEVRCGSIAAASGCFETEAWGLRDQPAFLNQALALHTRLDAHRLLRELLAIEQELGRERRERYGPRLIDIDILLFDQQVIEQPHLQVPHPQLPARRFALVPLCAIAAGVKHPLLGQTIAELLEQCADPSEVHNFPVS